MNDENLLIDKCRAILKTKCEDAFDKLAVLTDIKQRLEIDLQDKTEALRIDIDQLVLTERSSGLSHKPDPTKVSMNWLKYRVLYTKECNKALVPELQNLLKLAL